MSTTSASCCCEDTTRANYAIYVKGSGPEEFNKEPGWNQNSLNLYLNKVAGCKPCQPGKIHGGVTVLLYTEDAYVVSYGSLPDNIPEEIAPYTGNFIIPYSGGGVEPGTAVLSYFLDAGGVRIDDAKKKVNITGGGIVGGGAFWIRQSGLSVNEMINNIIEKYEKILVNGLPVKICDCFTDELYTSEEKTEDENFKAVALQALCKVWRVGVNAENIIWDTPIFLGTHDTTVANVGPGEYALESYLESTKQEIRWPPAQSKFATTFFLPKSWAKDRYTEPALLNMEALTGKNKPKEFREDPNRVDRWAPWIIDNPHDTDKTQRFKFIRLFLGALRLTPDGLNGHPFDGLVEGGVGSSATIVTPGVWDYSPTWTDPDNIPWSTRYSEAISRILSPSEAEYNDKVIVTKKGSASGILTEGTEGCDTSTACGGRRIGQADRDYNSGGTYAAPEQKIVKRPPETDILFARANIEYARGKDSSLFDTTSSNSIVYYTVNDDTKPKCPRLPPVVEGNYVSIPGGQSQVGCCCVTRFPTQYDSFSPDSGSSFCSTFYSSYVLGFPSYRRGKIGNEKNPYISFTINTRGNQSVRPYSYSRNIKFYAKYQPPTGCGSIVVDYSHMNVDTLPQAWWCSDSGQTQLGKIFYPKQTVDQTIKYSFFAYPQYYRGTSAKEVSNSSSGVEASAFYNCNINQQCAPNGGIGLLLTQIVEDTCVTGDNPDPDPVPGLGNGAQYICGGFGCTIPPGAKEACEDDRSGPYTSSDCLPGSYELRKWVATPITACQWLAMNGQDPYNNPQEVCCYRDTGPPGACDEFSRDADGKTCVENKILSPKNNPFVAFSKTRSDYGSLLTEIGSLFRVKKITKNSEGVFSDNPYDGVSVLDFTSSGYKQSLVTNLYGKKLEFGNIGLKSWAPVLENTYGPYGVDYRAPNIKPNNSRIFKARFGVDFERAIPGNISNGNLEQIFPQWPQAGIPPKITKSKAPTFSSSKPSEEQAQNIFKFALKWRESLYPKQVGTLSEYFYSLVTDYQSVANYDAWAVAVSKMKNYWDTRIRYELADIFTVYYDKGITGPYYPEGIPDLQYANKKIKIKKDASIEIVGVPEYELNWFHVPFERVITFE